jgi:hypothetical protein
VGESTLPAASQSSRALGEKTQHQWREPLPLSCVVDTEIKEDPLIRFLLFVILLFLCWPLALLALVLYPLIWLFLLPFRLLGFAVEGVLAFIKALFLLPARVLGGGR